MVNIPTSASPFPPIGLCGRMLGCLYGSTLHCFCKEVILWASYHLIPAFFPPSLTLFLLILTIFEKKSRTLQCYFFLLVLYSSLFTSSQCLSSLMARGKKVHLKVLYIAYAKYIFLHFSTLFLVTSLTDMHQACFMHTVMFARKF